MFKNIKYTEVKPSLMSIVSFILFFIVSYLFHDCSTEMSLLLSSNVALLTIAHFGNKPLFDTPIAIYAILILVLAMSINDKEIVGLEQEKITTTIKSVDN